MYALSDVIAKLKPVEILYEQIDTHDYKAVCIKEK